MIASVIVLNWNGWRDTLECLESLFRLGSSDYRVIVCDNASSDDSWQRIKAWAAGKSQATCSNLELSHLVSPPVPKPIPFREMTQREAESSTYCCNERLILIQNARNLGFAGGCNVGLRYALRDASCEFFWLLNNDTVVAPDSLSEMIHLMRTQPGVGLCGSLNLSYHTPNQVQVEGGKTYCHWTGRVAKPPSYTIEHLKPHVPRMDFVNGASMLASRAFLENIGLMDESYFLYFEELDWAMRAKGRFALGYSPASIIYHKEGASIGTNPSPKLRSLLCDQYFSRNRVLITKRFFPFALPTVLISVCAAAAHRLCLGDPKRAKSMLEFMLQGLRSHV